METEQFVKLISVKFVKCINLLPRNSFFELFRKLNITSQVKLYFMEHFANLVCLNNQ